MDNTNSSEMIFIGSNIIKSFGDTGEIGEYSVVFGGNKDKDFHGNYFDKNTFLGHNQGNGAVALINHRVPYFRKGQFTPEEEKALKAISDMRMKNPVETNVDDVGLFSKLTLDLSDKYEKMVYNLAKKGAFKWSSGTAPQTYKADTDGRLEMFAIVEQSLTPIPAEYRMLEHRVMPLKSYMDIINQTSEGDKSSIENFFKSMKPNMFLQALKGGEGSGFYGHKGRDEENLRGGSVPSRGHSNQWQNEKWGEQPSTPKYPEGGLAGLTGKVNKDNIKRMLEKYGVGHTYDNVANWLNGDMHNYTEVKQSLENANIYPTKIRTKIMRELFG